MANELSSLTINEVSVVDAPANSEVVNGNKVKRAVVALWKRDGDSFDRFRTIAPGEAKKGGAAVDLKTLKERVMKYIYPPMGSDSGKAKALTFAEVYSRVEAQEKFKELGEEFLEKLNVLQQVAWSIISDESVKDKQARINAAADDFVASVKQGLSEEAEKKANSDLRKLCKADDAWDDKDELCKAITGGVGKDGKTQAGVEYPKGDFAFTPDDTPSHWKLRLTSTPGGKPDPRIVGAAVAALGKGFRGKKAQIPAEALAGVKAKVRAAWRSANPDKGGDELPSVLKSEDKGETTMTLEQIEKRQNDQEAELAVLKAANAALVTENETVLKMSKKDRKLYATMDEAKRKEFLAGDAEKRGKMLAECATQKRETDLVGEMSEAEKAEFAKAGVSKRAAMLVEVEKKVKAKSGDKPGEGEPDADDEEEKEARKVLTRKLADSEDRIAKAETELTAIRKRERLVTFTKMAEEQLPHTPGRPEEKGERLMKLADALGGETSEAFKAELEEKRAADKALALQFREIGKAGGTVPVEKALDAKVEEIRKRDNIDAPHAMAKAMEEAPELYIEYTQQRQRRTA